ncbi:MAG: sugar ABC transporter permease [Chloroflexi bacterium]|nr:sugar ABC transporter permease [Chloroflexota bacterium]
MKKKSFLLRSITGRQGRRLKEYLTAYIFIAPASILVFLFGIFPVFFALYVSLHRWRIVRGDMIGLKNYGTAVGNLAYVIAFFLGIGALALVCFIIQHILKLKKKHADQPWLAIFPGFLFMVTVLAFFNWFYHALPEVLDIAFKVRGLERGQIVFADFLREALRAEAVLPAWRIFLLALLASVAVSLLIRRLWRNRRNFNYQIFFALGFLALSVGIGLLAFTLQEVAGAYEVALAEGSDPGIWPQVISISAGVLLLGAGYLLWRRAETQATNGGFWLHLLAALVLLVGGWLLIGEIPMIIANGDKQVWDGLKVTLFFSLGTVPVQLTLSIFLSVLLFQKLIGSNIFRIIYFIPYVTPAIASAAVFQQMFSNRHTAPVNMFLRALGLPPQKWLFEPRGVITLIAEYFGKTVPAWMAGPSLAMSVIILHSVWTFVGYNTVIYLAGLGNIPKELNDAAEVDGASGWQVFRHITFPLLSPTTYFLSLIGIIGTFKAFNTIWIFRSNMALGTTDTFSLVIFIEFFEKLRYGYASAMAFVLFGIILTLTLINNRIQGSRVFYG